jgi:hypothetical protein
MKYVVHKFALTDQVTNVNLEADAEVLYAARDSRLPCPAIWVRRVADHDIGKRHNIRTFRWVATGEWFEAPVGVRMFGPVRLEGELIFHVFEVKP